MLTPATYLAIDTVLQHTAKASQLTLIKHPEKASATQASKGNGASPVPPPPLLSRRRVGPFVRAGAYPEEVVRLTVVMLSNLVLYRVSCACGCKKLVMSVILTLSHSQYVSGSLTINQYRLRDLDSSYPPPSYGRFCPLPYPPPPPAPPPSLSRYPPPLGGRGS